MIHYLAGPYTSKDYTEFEYNMGRLFSYYLWMNLNLKDTIICPPLSSHGFDYGLIKLAHRNYLNDCLRILDFCQKVSFVPGWKNSEGCEAEFYKSYDISLKIHELSSFSPGEIDFLVSHLEPIQPYNHNASRAIRYLTS